MTIFHQNTIEINIMSVVYNFEPARIISPREPVTLILHSVIAASIPSRMASSLISESSHASPLPSNLKHLKRVRPSQQSEHLDLILHATDEIKDGEALSMIDCLPESISALVRQHDLSPFLTKVPFLAPETREQVGRDNNKMIQ